MMKRIKIQKNQSIEDEGYRYKIEKIDYPMLRTHHRIPIPEIQVRIDKI